MWSGSEVCFLVATTRCCACRRTLIPLPYGMPTELLSAVFHPDAGIGSSAQKFREVTEAYDVLSDPQRRQDHDVDLARSRAHFRVQPEPLIPHTPTHDAFRPFHVPPEPLTPVTPRRVLSSVYGIDQEIARMFQMMEDAFGQIW